MFVLRKPSRIKMFSWCIQYILLIYSILEICHSVDTIKQHICVTSSTNLDLIGVYRYLWLDIESHNPIFYQETSNYYLYTHTFNGFDRYQYIIARNLSGNNVKAYCNTCLACLPTSNLTTWNLNGCTDKWFVWDDNAACEWVLGDLIVEPCENPMKTLLSDQNVYITGGSEYDGIYYYEDWNLHVNGTIYYSPELNLYLFPFITHDGVYQYVIGNTINEPNGKAYCLIMKHSQFRYMFNVEDCMRNWFISVPVSKKLHIETIETYKCQHLPNMISVNQKHICVHGSDPSWLDQTFKWTSFNHTSNTSVYHGNNASIFVSTTANGQRLWVIAPDNMTYDMNVCTCNINNQLAGNSISITSCIIWNCGGKWNKNMVVDNNCRDVYVNGSYAENVNNAYRFLYWNNTINTAVYYCMSCFLYNGAYLHGYIEQKTINSSQYGWYISLHTYNFVFHPIIRSHCLVGENLGSFYVFNLRSCSGRWNTYWDNKWQVNEEMKVMNNLRGVISTQMQHTSVEIIGSYNVTLNGLYQYVMWNYHTNGAVYYNNISGLYLFPYLHDYNAYYYIISTHYDTIIKDYIAFCNITSIDNFKITFFTIEYCLRHWHVFRLSKWEKQSNMMVVSDMMSTNSYVWSDFIHKKVCVTGNHYKWLDGTYVFSHFDVASDSPIYYCVKCVENSHYGMYLYIWNKDDWHIGKNYLSEYYYSICNITHNNKSEYKYDLNSCNGKWKIWNGHEMKDRDQLVIITDTDCKTHKKYQYQNEIRKLLSDQNVYIIGSDMYDGTYDYHDWNPQVNGTIYYNQNLALYLFPVITTDGQFQYKIGDDTNSSNATVYCLISGYQQSRYIFDVEHCLNNWFISSTVIEMFAFKQNDICIHQTHHSYEWFDQIYKWSEFNVTDNVPVYRGSNSSILSLVTSNGNRKWSIVSDVENEMKEITCNISDISKGKHSYVFTLKSCILWNCELASHCNYTFQLANDCKDIYIIGSDIQEFNGQYHFLFFNKTTHSAVYHCISCNYHDGTYLYRYIRVKNRTRSLYWCISTVGYSSASCRSYCNVGDSDLMEAFYSYDLVDCNGMWRTFSNLRKWVADTDMKAIFVRDRTFYLEQHEMSPIIVNGSHNEINNGLYHYIIWSKYPNGPVYYNNISELYLFPYIYHHVYAYYYLINSHLSPVIDNYTSFCNITDLHTEMIRIDVLDVNHCLRHWHEFIDGKWEKQPNMISISIATTQRKHIHNEFIHNKMCVVGNYYSHLDGNYIFSHLEMKTNSPVYYCEECVQHSKYYTLSYYGMYLYFWDKESWQIGVSYFSPRYFSRCDIKYIKSEYKYNLTLCNGKWMIWNGNEMKDKENLNIITGVTCDSSKDQKNDSSELLKMFSRIFLLLFIFPLLLTMQYRAMAANEFEANNFVCYGLISFLLLWQYLIMYLMFQYGLVLLDILCLFSQIQSIISICRYYILTCTTSLGKYWPFIYSHHKTQPIVTNAKWNSFIHTVSCYAISIGSLFLYSNIHSAVVFLLITMTYNILSLTIYYTAYIQNHNYHYMENYPLYSMMLIIIAQFIKQIIQSFAFIMIEK
eukprot:328351_1